MHFLALSNYQGFKTAYKTRDIFLKKPSQSIKLSSETLISEIQPVALEKR